MYLVIGPQRTRIRDRAHLAEIARLMGAEVRGETLFRGRDVIGHVEHELSRSGTFPRLRLVHSA